MKNRHFSLFSTFVFLLTFNFILTFQTSQAQWVQTNGPEGGEIETLISSGDNIYAAMRFGGGIFASSNKGENWRNINSNLPNSNVSQIIKNSTYLFAATTFTGVYRSSNNGENWILANTGLSNYYIKAFAKSGENIFAGTNEKGIFLSSNDGESWTPVNTGLTDLNINCILVSDSKIFAGTANGIFLSTNNGSTWNSIMGDLTYATIISISVNGPNIFISALGKSNGGVFRTSNNGENWTPVNNGFQTWNITSLTTNGTDILATTQIGVYRSVNNGQTWSLIINGFDNYPEVHNCVISGGDIFIGTRNGVYFSTNGGNYWSERNNGLRAHFVWKLAGKNELLFASTGSGAFRSTNSGIRWQLIKGLPYPHYANNFAFSETNVYACDLGKVYKSSNDGQNWTSISNGLNNLASIYAIAVHENYLFAGTYANGMYRSTNNGESWSSVNNGLDGSSIWEILINNGKIYIATSQGVFYSDDMGDIWIRYSPSYYVQSIAIQENIFFAGTGSGLWVTTNNGVNWFSNSNGLPVNISINDLVVHGQYVFAGLGQWDGEVYLSTNNGVNWIKKNQGFNNFIPTVHSLCITNGFIYAATDGLSVWKRSITDIVGIEQISGSVPMDFMLKQNYPNPFNPMTNIEFSIPQPGNVRLDVYDVSGKLVESLLNKNLSTGSYNVAWNASRFSSGIYFYKLTAGNFVQTKKMMLVK